MTHSFRRLQFASKIILQGIFGEPKRSSRPFSIGRSKPCAVRYQEENGTWAIADLQKWSQRYVLALHHAQKPHSKILKGAIFCSTCWTSNFCPPIAGDRRYAILIKNNGLWANISYTDKAAPTSYAIMSSIGRRASLWTACRRILLVVSLNLARIWMKWFRSLA